MGLRGRGSGAPPQGRVHQAPVLAHPGRQGLAPGKVRRGGAAETLGRGADGLAPGRLPAAGQSGKGRPSPTRSLSRSTLRMGSPPLKPPQARTGRPCWMTRFFQGAAPIPRPGRRWRRPPPRAGCSPAGAVGPAGRSMPRRTAWSSRPGSASTLAPLRASSGVRAQKVGASSRDPMARQSPRGASRGRACGQRSLPRLRQRSPKPRPPGQQAAQRPAPVGLVFHHMPLP